MADRNWLAGRKNSIPAQALVCLLATAAPCATAWAAPLSGGLAPDAIGESDASLVWQLLIGGIVVASFLTAIGIWALAALSGARHEKLRRSEFITSALNNLNQGVMITNAQTRVVFCNDRFLEMYGFSRADVSSEMLGSDLVALRHARGLLNVTAEEFGK